MIYGPGRLGGAGRGRGRRGRLAGAVAGRPTRPDGHRPTPPRADVVVDASTSAAVAANVEEALLAGNRAFVLATTGWDADIGRIRGSLIEHGATAIAAPNLSLGAALFLRLAEVAAGWYARAGSFEPSIVEWHRRGKADRPSGTARALARRIVAADPRWATSDAFDGRPVLEVAGIRAGAAPGTHLVTFDGPGESIELRLAARDRSAYADGALAAARWLVREPREPGLHPFDAVVDDLLADDAQLLPA